MELYHSKPLKYSHLSELTHEALLKIDIHVDTYYVEFTLKSITSLNWLEL